jgi:hypothetical protein
MVHCRVHKEEPITGPCPEPDASSPHLPIHLDPFQYYPPSTPRSSEWSLPFRYPGQHFVRIYFYNACYMAHPSHPQLDHRNIWSVQVLKLLVLQSSLAPYHFLPLRSKFPPQHPVPEHLYLFPSLSERDQVSHPYKRNFILKVAIFGELFHVWRICTM